MTWTTRTQGGSTTDGTSFTTASVSPAANSLVLLVTSSLSVSSGDQGSPTSVGGGNFTKIADLAIGADYGHCSVWRYLSATPFSGTVNLTWATSQDTVSWAILEKSGVDLSGANGSGAVGTVASAGGTSTAPSPGTISFAGTVNETFVANCWGDAVSATIRTQTPDADFTERQEQSNADSAWYTALATNTASNQQTTQVATLSASQSWASFGFEVKLATVDQEGFRFGADDGSESAHGWLAGQDVNATVALDSTFLARVLLNATGDPDSAPYTLRAQKNGAGGYAAVPVGSGNAEAFALPTWGAVGTAASGTTSCAPAYPTGIAAATSKLLCIVTGRSNTANTAFTMPAGWTSLGQFEGGTGTWGVDAGTRRVGIFLKDTTTGSESGTVTVSLSGTTANTLRAGIHRIQVPSGYNLETSFASGADTTSGTAFSALASSSQTLDSNRLLLIAVASARDSATQSAQSITASGITFGTRTNRASTAVTNGRDHRHIIDTVPVSSGSGTVAATYAYTASANTSGPAAFLVMRAQLPAVNNEFFVKLSANITAGGEATTARLTAPSGKTTSDFDTGRRWDDENGTDSIDITLDDYTELEWSLGTQAPAVDTDYWDLRVYAGAIALASYTVTPRLTIGAGGASGPVGTSTEVDLSLALGSARPAGLSSETNTALALSGAQIIPAGLATETDAALALASIHTRVAGLAVETDAALALGVARPAGMSSETDSALSLPAAQLRVVGRADETDAALPLAGAQQRTVGIALETDTALALSAAADMPVGTATEADAALALAAVQIALVGAATETDAALTLAGVHLRAVGLATEADTALALSAVAVRSAGLASETNAALALSAVQVSAVGVAVEADLALALGVAVPVGVATETDASIGLAGVQIRGTGRADETSTALALSSAQAIVVGLAAETDAALALGIVQSLGVGLAGETDTALALSAGASAQVGVATEVDAALALTPVQIGATGRADETNAALALTASAGGLVGMAAEASTAFALPGIQIGVVGLAADVEAAFALAPTQIRMTGQANETDAAFALVAVLLKQVGVAAESDTALALASPGGGPVEPPPLNWPTVMSWTAKPRWEYTGTHWTIS